MGKFNGTVSLIVSENTKQQATEFTYRELDSVRVKGKALPITIYEPIAKTIFITEDTIYELKEFEQVLTAYRAQEWNTAQLLLSALKQSYPERKIYALYYERVEHFRSHPPSADWDGVFTFTTK